MLYVFRRLFHTITNHTDSAVRLALCVHAWPMWRA